MKKVLIILGLFVFLGSFNFACAGMENEVLIVVDNDAISNHGDNTSVAYYESILENMNFGNNKSYSITIWNEYLSADPSLSYLQLFGTVIWTIGDYTVVAPSSLDIVTLENYVVQGGNLIISGAWLINDYGQNSYTDNVLHANAPTRRYTSLKDINVTNITHRVTTGFVQNELFNLIPSPTNFDDYRPDVIENIVSGGQILSVRGSTSADVGTPTIVVFENETNTARVIYVALPIFLLNETNRTNLVENSMDWMDNYIPTVNAVNLLPSDSLDDLDPDVQINFTVNITDLHNVSVVKLEYRCVTGAGLCSPGTEDFTSMTMSYNLTTELYENASFTPDVPGIWQYRIWSNDTLGNGGYDDIVNLSIEYDYSWTETFDAPDSVSCIFSDERVLGNLTINNTGDFDLSFDLSSNYEDTTYNVTEPFDLTAKESIVVQVNATAGEVLLESNIVVTIDATTANADPSEDYANITFVSYSGGAYLSGSLVSYVEEVSQSGSFNLSGSVENLGNETALNSSLIWEMPSSFWTNTSGNLTQDIGNLTEDSTESNNVTISVPSSVATGLYTIYLNSTCSNNVSGCSDVESFSIFVNCSDTDGVCGEGCTFQNDADCSSQIIVGGGGGSTGGGSAKPYVIEFSKIIEILRGEGDEFEIEINNTYRNTTLENLTLEIVGFPAQYITIIPRMISKIGYGTSEKFVVKLEIPSYEGYKEFILNATITGVRKTSTTSINYIEKQHIKLISQEVSREESNASILEAEVAIFSMREKGFNIEYMEELFEKAKGKLEDKRNKEAQDLAQEIIDTKEKAFFVEDLISRIKEVLKNPRRLNLLSGNVIKDLQSVEESGNMVGNVMLGSSSAEEILNLALVAFGRGDYGLAEERAEFAQFLILFERKGNFILFLYLYWYYFLAGILLFSIAAVIVYRKYQKWRIVDRIRRINEREENIRKLMIKNQKDYFSKKISSEKYNTIILQYRKKLAQMRNSRIQLRSKRMKILNSRQIFENLEDELGHVRVEIKKLQESYYKDKGISPKEYEIQFKMLNERLVEIEGERITLELMQKRKYKRLTKIENLEKHRTKISIHKIKLEHGFVEDIKTKLNYKIGNFFGLVKELKKKLKLFSKLKKDKRGVMLIDSDFIEMIKSHVKDKDCKGKWLHINCRGGRNEDRK